MATSEGVRKRTNGHIEPSNSPKMDERSKEQTKQTRTLSWREVPAWMQDNEFILTGYRRLYLWMYALHLCMCVLAFCLLGETQTYLTNLPLDTHNETVNIHTHLWGAVLFGFFLSSFYSHLNQYDSVNYLDIAGFVVFLVSAVLCLSFSSLYHTMSAHSKEVHDSIHVFDYAGIVILIVGSFVPSIYYAFYCKPHFQIVYLSGISIAGIAAAYIVLSPEYGKPEYRGARTKVFILLGLFAVLPITHAMFIFGMKELFQEMGFGWIVTSGALYIIGALIYANRIPERWFKDSQNRFFDKWFSSHQIFHVYVVLAALAHYVCILQALQHRHGASEGICLIP